jgi:hypothetical protein
MKNIFKFPFLSVLVFLVIGCGGGGDSTSTPDSASLVSNTLVTSLDSNETKSGNVVVKNVSSTSVSYSIKYDSNSSVAKNGNFTYVSQNANGEFTFSLDINGTELGDGNFTLSSTFPSAGNDLSFTHSFVVKNLAPTWTASSYNTGIDINDSTNAQQTIFDLTTVSSDFDGDEITYSIENITPPHVGDQTRWENSTYIDASGVLKVQNLTINDPNIDGTVIVTIRATADGGYNDANVSFTFTDTQ